MTGGQEVASSNLASPTRNVQVRREVLACQVLDHGEQVVPIFEPGVSCGYVLPPEQKITSPVLRFAACPTIVTTD